MGHGSHQLALGHLCMQRERRISTPRFERIFSERNVSLTVVINVRSEQSCNRKVRDDKRILTEFPNPKVVRVGDFFLSKSRCILIGACIRVYSCALSSYSRASRRPVYSSCIRWNTTSSYLNTTDSSDTHGGQTDREYYINTSE